MGMMRVVVAPVGRLDRLGAASPPDLAASAPGGRTGHTSLNDQPGPAGLGSQVRHRTATILVGAGTAHSCDHRLLYANLPASRPGVTSAG